MLSSRTWTLSSHFQMSLDYTDAMARVCKQQGDEIEENGNDDPDSAIESSEFKVAFIEFTSGAW